MKIIALTGGIASGKTTVAKFFEACGAKIIDADKIAHQTYRPRTPLYRQIVKRYGKKILSSNRQINRHALGEILFNKPKEKRWLEAKIHPLTLQLIATQLRKLLRKKPPLILVEAALHVETGYYKDFPKLMVVKASKTNQLERLISREGLSLSQAKTRIKNQMPFTKKCKVADWVIDNSSSLAKTKQQVRRLFQKLVKE